MDTLIDEPLRSHPFVKRVLDQGYEITYGPNTTGGIRIEASDANEVVGYINAGFAASGAVWFAEMMMIFRAVHQRKKITTALATCLCHITDSRYQRSNETDDGRMWSEYFSDLQDQGLVMALPSEKPQGQKRHNKRQEVHRSRES